MAAIFPVGSCTMRLTRVEGWGVTGWSNEFGALADDSAEPSALGDAYGFERILDPGVVYREQPEIPGVPRWVEKPQAKGRVFQMGWPTPEAPATQSLLDIQAGIAARRKTLAAEDPQLAKLDEAIHDLVDIAGRLRAAGASIGFVQPDSVRIGSRHDGSTFVVMPDLGFAWDDSGGLYEPDWLATPPAELLFDRGARARNADYLVQLKRAGDEGELRERAKELAVHEVEDVRIVARLIAMALAGGEEVKRWCGAAKSLRRLPGKDVAPDTAAPIWDQVIAPALDGRIPTFQELRLRLGAAKPSEHFLFKPPTPPWRGWGLLRQAGLVAAAVAVLFGLWWLMDVLFPARKYAPYCRQVAKEEGLYAKLFDLQALEAKAKVDRESRPGFWKLLQECRADHAGLGRCGEDCLRGPVNEYFEMTLADGDAVLTRLRANPRPVAEERPEIAAAIAAIGEAATAAKRDPRPAVVKKLDRQLQLRGGAGVRPAAAPASSP